MRGRERPSWRPQVRTLPPSPHSPRPPESCGEPATQRTRGRPHLPWLLATCPAAAGRAVSRGRKRPTLQSNALTSLHPMAGARRAPRDLGPPKLPVLPQAGGDRRRPAGLRCLHCRRGLRGPGRAHPPPASRGTAAARRARAGGGAGTPAAALPRGAAALATGRAPATSRRWRRGGGVAPLSLRRLRPVAPSAPQERPSQPQQPPAREQPPPPAAPHGVPHPRPEAAPRGFRLPRWSATRARRAGDFSRSRMHQGNLQGGIPDPPPPCPALPLAPLSQSLSLPLCRGAIRNQAALV
ncbi:WAS/WASL-interacting protein family member 1-like [Aphelocoma coerulescens]|uniref:WAS/WASL-interacting protein family member 1-like n=1 Tax=Aphelocoma coerulescens TaxID=39617 RepID=UPI00360521D6